MSAIASNVSVEAWYAAAWLSARLPDAKLRFESVDRIMDNGLQGIVLDGPDFEVSVLPSGPASVEIKVDSFCGRVVLPEMAEWRLVEQELSILGNDSVYEAALALASKLARSKP